MSLFLGVVVSCFCDCLFKVWLPPNPCSFEFKLVKCPFLHKNAAWTLFSDNIYSGMQDAIM